MENQETNLGGRPTIYGEAILEKSREYENNLPSDEIVHSIEGLSDYIKVARSTIYKWILEEDKTEFSDIVARILAKQGKKLINKGLKGDFSAPITKVMLTKHGYREGTDITTKDKEVQPVLVRFLDDNNRDSTGVQETV